MSFRRSWMSRIQSFPIHQMPIDSIFCFSSSSKKQNKTKKTCVSFLFCLDDYAKKLFRPHLLFQSGEDFFEFSQRIQLQNRRGWMIDNALTTSSLHRLSSGKFQNKVNKEPKRHETREREREQWKKREPPNKEHARVDPLYIVTSSRLDTLKTQVHI